MRTPLRPATESWAWVLSFSVFGAVNDEAGDLASSQIRIFRP